MLRVLQHLGIGLPTAIELDSVVVQRSEIERVEKRDRTVTSAPNHAANSVTDVVLQPSTIERIEVFREKMQRINFVVYIISPYIL